MASVEIRDVRKAFGPVQIIKGVSVPIADGEFVVLVGPSGCGKSTLLRMIAGLENITGGTISIGDRVVNNVHPKERDIAMVFQNYALYPHMTVGENMGFSLKLRNTDKRSSPSGLPRLLAFSASINCWIGIRASCRAASVSGLRWAAPSSAIRKCSCLTSRCRTLTPNCGWPCARRLRSCING
jgi:ABC-type sugar transport system ATPase subunit